MAKVTKLGIATATSGLMEARTAFSLATAMMRIQVPMQMFLGIGCYIHHNREICVDQALKADCSHILFVDTDVMFTHDAIARMLAHAVNGIDIVGARYNKKILPIESTVKEDIHELSEVHFVPTGFMLINMEVFKKISKPYFAFNNDEKDSSEDLYFCKKAIENGFKVYCDPLIEIGHLGTAVY